MRSASSRVPRPSRRGVDAYVVMEEAAAAVPPGANGVLGIFANVMDAKRWVQAAPVVPRASTSPTRGVRPQGVHPRDRGAGRVHRARGHLDIVEELTGGQLRRARVHGRSREGQAVAADRRRRRSVCPSGSRSSRSPPRSGRRSAPASARASIGTSARPRRARPVRAHVRAAARRAHRLRRALRGVAQALYPQILELSEDGLLPPDVVAGRGRRSTSRPGTRLKERTKTMPEADSSETQALPRGRAPAEHGVLPEGRRLPTTGGCSTGWRGSSGPRAAGR